MAYISQITLPSGTTYDIKDAEARNLIAALDGSTSFLGVTTTELTDGSTTNPITINSESVTADTGSIATYGSKEFVWNGSAWQEFGDLSALGSFAFKNNLVFTYTPQGTIGNQAVQLKTPHQTEQITQISDVGSMPVLSTTVANEVLTIGWTAGTTPSFGTAVEVITSTGRYEATVAQFTGTQVQLTLT